MKALYKLRLKLDRIDIQIIRLLVRRFNIIRKIAHLKGIHQLNIQDEKREKEQDQILNFTLGKVDGDKKFVKNVFFLIRKYSRIYQKNLRSKQR